MNPYIINQEFDLATLMYFDTFTRPINHIVANLKHFKSIYLQPAAVKQGLHIGYVGNFIFIDGTLQITAQSSRQNAVALKKTL